MLCTVIYNDGQEKKFNEDEECLELELVKASYKDETSTVEKLLEEDIDVNATVLHSNNRGNGIPLILTSNTKIAKLLVKNGANINAIYDTGSAKITAMDSILREFEKVKKSNEKKEKEISNFIKYLESKGAKKYSDLERSN